MDQPQEQHYVVMSGNSMAHHYSFSEEQLQQIINQGQSSADGSLGGDPQALYRALTQATIQDGSGEYRQVYVALDQPGDVALGAGPQPGVVNMDMSSAASVQADQLKQTSTQQVYNIGGMHVLVSTEDDVPSTQLPTTLLGVDINSADHAELHATESSAVLPSAEEPIPPTTSTAEVVEQGRPMLPSPCPDPSEVFSNVQATLSHSLLAAIPGSKEVCLRQVGELCQVKMEHDDIANTVTVNGAMKKLLRVQDYLRQLCNLPKDKTADDSWRKNNKNQVGTCEKAVSCELLRPQYSRSGREVKPRILDLPDDYTVLEPERKYRSGGQSRLIKKVKGAKRKKETKVTENKDVKLKTNEVADVKPLISEQEVTHCEVLPSHDLLPAELTIPKLPAELTDAVENVTTLAISQPHGPLDQIVALQQKSEDAEYVENIVGSLIEEGHVEDEQEEQQEASSMYQVRLVEQLPEDIILGRKKPKKDYEKLTPFKFFCNLCSFKSKRESHFIKHQKIHDRNLPLLRCEHCNFTTVRLSHLRRHELSHSSSVYQCPKCKYRTSNPKLLNRHYRLKHHLQSVTKSDKMTIYKCPNCDYSTLKAYMYQRHLKVHMDVTGTLGVRGGIVSSYKCDICPYKTQRKEHFIRHMRTVHLKKVHSDRGPLHQNLDIAQQIQNSNQEPSLPLNETTPDDFQPFQQNLEVAQDPGSSSYQVQNRGPGVSLKYSEMTPSEGRPFICEICGRGFKRSDALRQHKVIHQEHGKRSLPFKCTICPKGFRSKAHMKEHLAKHTNLRTYLCELCGAAFKTRSVQRKHVLTIHQNPRSHPCEQCDKRFNTKYALRRHQRTHAMPQDTTQFGLKTLQPTGFTSKIAIIKGDDGGVHVLQEEVQPNDQNIVTVTETSQHITTETIQATATIEETMEQTMEQSVDTALKQIPQSLIQSSDGILYLTSFSSIN